MRVLSASLRVGIAISIFASPMDVRFFSGPPDGLVDWMMGMSGIKQLKLHSVNRRGKINGENLNQKPHQF
jgi:hypothetical protein